MKKYEGRVLWLGGIPKIQFKERFLEYLKNFPDDTWFSLEIAPCGPLNESKQRNLYFLWCNIIAEFLGYSEVELHEEFKRLYLQGKSTKGMNTKQWSDFMLKVQAFSADKGIILPKTEEDD